MATLKDIAKIANVNISTVSKALRSNCDLNPKTIFMIRNIADQLNYSYDVSEDANKKIAAIGIVCPEILSSFYTNILDSFQTHLSEAKYDTILTVSNFSSEKEMHCIDLLIKCNVSGIICFTESAANSSRLKEISELNDITFLLVSTVDDNEFCHSISIDDKQGALMAVNHLAEIGHQRIAYIGDSLSEVRKSSFIQALQRRGLVVNDDYIIENNLRFEECGYEGMKQLMMQKILPTGIFAAYDNIAIGAMRAIYEQGLSIPEDFSIVGIDNIKTSSYLYRSLTTVTEPTSDLGEIACSLMLDQIKNKMKPIQTIKLKPTLNIRESTSPLTH